MISLATYNIKGGVGKTTAAVNLAWEAAVSGRRTLLWDLDPQGAAGFYLGIDADAADRPGLLDKKKVMPELIRPSRYPRLDVLPADLSIRNLDLELHDRNGSQKRVRKRLDYVAAAYDLAIIDCAPSLSLVSENVFHAVDWLLVPIIPTPLSIRAYDQLCRFRATDPALTAGLMPFFAMVDRRRKLHRQLIHEFAAAHPEVLSSYIPYASDIERMGERCAPVGVYAATGPGGRSFAALWHAIEARLTGAEHAVLPA